MSLTFKKFSRVNARRCETVYHPIKAWSPTDWACALSGEVGEACNFIKKLRRLDDKPVDLDTFSKCDEIKKEIAKELADVMAYLDLLATALDIDLEQAIIAKFNEVSDCMKCGIKL